MINNDFERHFKILVASGLVVLIATLILEFFGLSSSPVTMSYGFFIAEITRRRQATTYPELDCSWMAIFKFLHSDHDNQLNHSGEVLERFFSKLSKDLPTIYYADAIPRLSNSLPSSIRSSVKSSLLRYEAMTGICKGDADAVEIMSDRANNPEFIKNRTGDQSRVSNHCVEFCQKVTGVPEILVRIVIFGEAFSNNELPRIGDLKKIEVVRTLSVLGTKENTKQIRNYLNTQAI
jgi:hypothetical protein